MRIRIDKMNLLVILLWSSIFPFYIPNEKLYYVYQFVAAIVVGFFAIYEYKRIPGILFLCSYPLIIILSCVYNSSSILYTQIFRGSTLALLIMDIFLLLHKYIRTKSSVALFNILYSISKLYVIINLLWTLLLVVTGRINEAVEDGVLFSKSKFTVAYTCVFFLMFYCVAWNGNKLLSVKHKKPLFVVLSLICIALSMVVQTATGTVALILFMFLMLMPRKILKPINNPLVLVILIIVSMWGVFSLSLIISLPLIQTLIVDFFNKDLTLTGRLYLYELLYPILFKSGLLGGGFGSYVAQSLGYHGWYNAQNGLAEIVLTYGFLGGISFLGLVYFSAYHSKRYIEPINAAIFVFIIVAIVEIPFTERFILLLALLMFTDSQRIEESAKFPRATKLVLRRKK